MSLSRFASSIAGYFRHWRYQPSIVLVLYAFMYLGWIGLGGGLDDLTPGALGRVAAGWGASTAVLLAIFLVNDAADREGDCLAHPERPIPRGLADWRDVFALGVLLLVLAVALGLATGQRAAIVATALAAGGLLHYGYLKRRLPFPSEIVNPAVSVLFPLFALSVAGFDDPASTGYLLGFIYLADLAHDLLGGIHDVEGDAECRVPTFARSIGDRATAAVSFVAFLAAAASGFLLAQGGRLGRLYLVVLTALTAFLIYRYVGLLQRRGAELAIEAGRINHLGGGYFFLVSASTFLDHLARPWLG